MNAELGGSSFCRRPCAPSRGSSGALDSRPASAIARSETEANASPGGHISDFCEPATTTSTPHSSCGRSTAPRPETASTQSTESCAVVDLVERADVVEDAGRGLRLGREHRPRRAAEAGERLVEARRVHLLAPLELQVHGVGAVGVAELGPALAELAAGGNHGRVAGANEVGDCGLHRGGSRGREAQDLVARLEDQRQPLQHPRVDLDERRGTVIEDRLRHHLRDARRQRRRSRGQHVLLGEMSGASAIRSGYGRARRTTPPGCVPSPGRIRSVP